MGAEQIEAPLEQSWIDFMLGLIAEPTSSSPSNAASEAADTATCPASVVDDDHPLRKAARRTGTEREMWDARCSASTMAADLLGANDSYVCKCFRPGNCIGNITPNNMKSCRELNRACLRSIEGTQKKRAARPLSRQAAQRPGPVRQT